MQRIMKGQPQPDDTGFVLSDHASIISRGLVPFSDLYAYFKSVVLPRASPLSHVDLGLHEPS
jgi:hypothetical protein